MININEITDNCLNCKIKPCSIKGCPLGNDIPQFIEQIKQGNIEKAYEILSETTVLQAVCGRICPHTKQCEGSCVRGIKSKSRLSSMTSLFKDILLYGYDSQKPMPRNPVVRFS